MLDCLGMVAALERPRLLVRAARFAAQGYDRGRCLPRLIESGGTLRSGAAILRLLEAESALDGLRRARDANYAVRRHVEVLAALLGESRLLRESLRPRLVA